MTEQETSRIVSELRKERRKQGRRNKQSQGEAAPPEEVVLTVESMAHKGAALGRLDGRVGLVDYAIPGEEVRVAIRQGKRDYFAGEAVEVLRAAPERIAPLALTSAPAAAASGNTSITRRNWPSSAAWSRSSCAGSAGST